MNTTISDRTEFAHDDGPEDVGPTASRRHWRLLFPDPKTLLIVFRRNMRLFFGIFLLVIIAVAAWTVTRTPIYSATSSLLVLPQADQVVKVEAVTPDLPATTDIVNTEVRLMQSPALALRVASHYALQHTNAKIVRDSTLQELAESITDMTSVTRSASTYVIEVNVSSQDPQQAADIANLYASQFVLADREAKVNTNLSANQWLVSRTRQLANDAQDADAALQAYKVQNGLISSEGTTLSEQEISSLDGQIAQAQADLAEKQGRLNAARKQLNIGGGGADVSAALGSGTIGTLRAREAEASATVAQLAARYGEKYPDLVQARSQLASIRQNIQLEIDRILSNLQAEVNVSSSRLSSLEGSRSHSTGVLSTNNRAQVGLLALQRRSDAAKAIYETFLNRSHETSAQQGLQRADTRVDSIAQVPEEPEFPNRRLAAALGVLGGIGAGLAAIGLAEYLQTTLRTKVDVEQRLGARYAGSIPTLGSTLGKLRNHEPPHDYVLAYPQSTFAESLRSLRAFLLLGGGMPEVGRSIAIASALPQEGKTTTALCLARLSAANGISTVLVDCDVRRHGSSDLLGNTGNGLYDYFGGAGLDEALVHDPASGLALLGVNGERKLEKDPLTAENMARLLRDLRKRFQLIIMDTAPVLGVADARIVAAAADRTLVCARWRKTSVQAANATIDLLVSAGVRLSGVALTQVDIRSQASSGYAESYNYHKQFRGYYVN